MEEKGHFKTEYIKFIWGTILFIFGVVYISNNYTRLSINANLIDNIIIGGTIILAFFPIVSEISLMGFSVRKELHTTKQEIRDEIFDLKTQIYLNTNQTNNQSINFNSLSPIEKLQDLVESSKESEISEEVNKQDSTTAQDKKTVPVEEKDKKVAQENRKDEKINSSEYYPSEDARYLFTVRYRLEKLIADINYAKEDKYSGSMLRVIADLRNQKYISMKIYESIREILNICNRGIHGEIVDEYYIDFVRDMMPYVVSSLKKIPKNSEVLYPITCSKCHYVGYSKVGNVCPECHSITDDY